MPTYNFQNKETGEDFQEYFESWQAKDTWLEENPNIKQMLGTPGFISNKNSTLRMAGDGWKDLLGEIKKKSGKGNTINI